MINIEDLIFGVSCTLDIQTLVGTECGKHLHIIGIVVSQLLVIAQIVNRIIGGAEQLDTGITDDVSCGHIRLGEDFVAKLPYGVAGIFVEDALIAEVTL